MPTETKAPFAQNSDNLTDPQGEKQESNSAITTQTHQSEINKYTDQIKKIRVENINNVIVGNFNINSLSSKFDQLDFLVHGYFDILVITETKLDNSFPISQFKMDGCSTPYRLDRNRNGGGIIIYVREDIPSKLLRKHILPDDIEALFLEINLKKQKWLFCGYYHPPSQSDNYYFDNIQKTLDVYSNYEKNILAGDFNAQEGE